MKTRIALLLIVLGGVLPIISLASEGIITKAVNTDFADVRIDIDNAIANRGFVVDFKSNIGAMLERTAADVGSSGAVFKHAETWQFCSSILSRKMVEVDPANIAYCPYTIFAYETIEKPGVVVVGFRLLSVEDGASKAILDEINGHLEAIANDVAE